PSHSPLLHVAPPSFTTRRSSDLYGRGYVVLGMAGGYATAALAALDRQMGALPGGTPPPRRALTEPRRIEGMEVLLVDKPSAASTDRKSTRLNSSHVSISYAVFCL